MWVTVGRVVTTVWVGTTGGFVMVNRLGLPIFRIDSASEKAVNSLCRMLQVLASDTKAVE